MSRSRLSPVLALLILACLAVAGVKYALWSAASSNIALLRERWRRETEAAARAAGVSGASAGPAEPEDGWAFTLASLGDAELLSTGMRTSGDGSTGETHGAAGPSGATPAPAALALQASSILGDGASPADSLDEEATDDEDEGEFIGQVLDEEGKRSRRKGVTAWCWHGSCEGRKARPPDSNGCQAGVGTAAEQQAQLMDNATLASLTRCPGAGAVAALAALTSSGESRSGSGEHGLWPVSCTNIDTLSRVRSLGFGSCKQLFLVLAPSRPKPGKRVSVGQRGRGRMLAIMKVSGAAAAGAGVQAAAAPSGSGRGDSEADDDSSDGGDDGSDDAAAESGGANGGASCGRSSVAVCAERHLREMRAAACLQGSPFVPQLLGGCVRPSSVVSVHALVPGGFDLGSGLRSGSTDDTERVPEPVADAASARRLAQSVAVAERALRIEKRWASFPTAAELASGRLLRLPMLLRMERSKINRRLLAWAVAKQLLLLFADIEAAGGWFDDLSGSSLLLSKGKAGNLHGDSYKVHRLWLVDTSGLRIGRPPPRPCKGDLDCPPTSYLHCCCGDVAFDGRWACRGAPEAAGVCELGTGVCAHQGGGPSLAHAAGSFSFLLPAIRDGGLPELQVLIRALTRDRPSSRPSLEQAAAWLDRNAPQLLSQRGLRVDRANLTAPMLQSRGGMHAAREAAVDRGEADGNRIVMSARGEGALPAELLGVVDIADEAAEDARLRKAKGGLQMGETNLTDRNDEEG